MRKRVLIVMAILIANILAFTLQSHAQGYGVQNLKYSLETKEVKSYELLADETTITDTKTGAKIECSNDKVHFKLYQKWQHTFLRYAWSWKKDRKGPYKLYSITVSRKDADLIREWAKTNL